MAFVPLLRLAYSQAYCPVSIAMHERNLLQSQIEAGQDEIFDYAAVQLWLPGAPRKAFGDYVLAVALSQLGLHRHMQS